MRELEHVQKRAMFIICPGHSYHEALDIMNFKELAIHHDEMCESLFDSIVNNHRLNKLLPAAHETTYLLRRARPFMYHASQPGVLRIVLLFLHVLRRTHLGFPFF